MAISGECADVKEEMVAGWHEKLKFIMNGYQPQDVFFIEHFPTKHWPI